MRGTQDLRFVYSSEVTIASADPDNPAVLKSMLLQSVKNLTIDGVKFDLVTTAATSLAVSSFRVDTSSDITFRNATFDGDVYKGSNAVDNGYGAGYGLQSCGPTTSRWKDSSFSTFRVSSLFHEIKNLVLRNNTYDSSSGDSIKLSAITKGLIEGNHVKSIRANPDSDYHRDMIQVFTNGTDTPSTDLVIRGNILNSGDSKAASQSILMRNEVVDSQGGGKDMHYANVLIEDNVIYNAHSNAISVGYADGLSIRNNTLLQNTASAARNAINIPVISIANSSDVDISKNITHKIVTSNISGLTNSDNYIVQRIDPLADNFYDKLFVAARPDATIEALQALPGGAIEKLGIGSSLTRFDPTPDHLTALAVHRVDKGTHTFDASLSAGPGGLTGASASYRWDFGDGTSASGMKVSHSYVTPGEHEVTLTVTSGGKSDDFRFLAKSTDPRLLSLRLTDGNPDDASTFDAGVNQDGVKVSQPGGVFTLTDHNHFSVDRGHTDHLHGLDEFMLSFDLKRASGGPDFAGRIVGINKSWSVSLDKSGMLTFELTNRDGKTYKMISTAAITDTDWHSVDLRFDGTAGSATLHVDDVAAGSIAVSGATPAYSYWGVTVGNPFGPGFEGMLRNIDLFESAEGDRSGPPAPDPSPGMEVWLIDAGSDKRILALNDGAVIGPDRIASGEYSIEVVPEDGVRSIRFQIGDLTKVENIAPYALFGDRSGGMDFSGAHLPAGQQTVTIEAFSGRNATGAKIATDTIDFTFSAGGSAPAGGSYDLAVSGVRSRSGATDLADATISDDAFIFVTGSKDVRKVSFWLDDPLATGTPDRVEKLPWHDFASTAPDGYAKPWDTTEEADGRHTITAEIIAADGSRHLISDSFAIDNMWSRTVVWRRSGGLRRCAATRWPSWKISTVFSVRRAQTFWRSSRWGTE